MMRLKTFFLSIFTVASLHLFTQEAGNFNGLNLNMSNLSRLSNAQSRSISPENLSGEKGKGGMTKLEDGSAKYAARELGLGWKVNPYVVIKPGETFIMAEIDGEGAIQHIWMTPTGIYRLSIFRFYWDGEKEPSVEVPVGDFFASAWEMGNEPDICSLPVCVNPLNGFNCYWQMPFRKKCKITMENLSKKNIILFYQIDYTLTEVPDDAAYFHAQFRRVNPMPEKEDFVMLDNVKGQGQYVGTYLAHGANSPGWWGEGEVKFFIDGDKDFPTICGTGEEDYFCGSYCYEMRTDMQGNDQYTNYSTPYAGFYHVIDPANRTGQGRFGEYRWHVTDPIRFKKDLKVTIQGLGWKSNSAYLPLEDDMASVVFWYQTEPHNSFPQLPSNEQLIIMNSLPVEHFGLNKKVELIAEPSQKYNNDPVCLTDGILGSKSFNDGNWMGFEGNDMVAIIDLEGIVNEKTMKVDFLSDQNSWIFLPEEVEFLISVDGVKYTSIFSEKNYLTERPLSVTQFETQITSDCKFLKIIAKNIGLCPEWHKGAGRKAWMFVDEIIIE